MPWFDDLSPWVRTPATVSIVLDCPNPKDPSKLWTMTGKITDVKSEFLYLKPAGDPERIPIAVRASRIVAVDFVGDAL